MNRKERRAARRTSGVSGAASRHGGPVPGIADLLDDARRQYRRGNATQAEAVCRQILARDPANTDGLNLVGVIAQASGRHQLAVKMLARAIESDPFNAACHYNIGLSYQALERQSEAADQFNKAIALGLSEKNVEDFILQNPVVARTVQSLQDRRVVPILSDDATSLATVAKDIFLRCAMESILIRGVILERYFTALRSVLLRFAVVDAGPIDAAVIDHFCALARQCFINEYIFAQSAEESRQAGKLRALLLNKLKIGNEIAPILVAAVAAFYALHSLPEAVALLDRDWPQAVNELLRQQVREPREEQQDRAAIPSLTPIEGDVSLDVMRQYEENPFPRWTVNPVMPPGRRPDSRAGSGSVAEILIAGCGTGQHVFQIVELFPDARALAVDISRPSLAYARRKSREAGLDHVEYAQADIMKLGAIGRTFDRIEVVGVLHHLADPQAGWRVLLSLLRPDGEMHVGLYSEMARRNVVAARRLIAERGFRPTPEDIRTCRDELLRTGSGQGWAGLDAFSDFYCMSGCRDLIFNVMEHRFTIPEIKTFLAEEGLFFLGFQLETPVMAAFRRQFPEDAALRDLDCWHAFETSNPDTFASMYIFSVSKNPPTAITPPSPSRAA